MGLAILVALAAALAPLPPKAAKAHEDLVAAFERFQSADAKRAYQLYINDERRVDATKGQEDMARAGFDKLVATLVEKRALPTATEKELSEAEAKLTGAVERSISEYETAFGELLKAEPLKDSWPTYRRYIDEHTKVAKETHAAWIAYRDRWTRFAEALHGAKAAPKSAGARGVLLDVTRVRLDELGRDPLPRS